MNFWVTFSFRQQQGPGFDLAPSENEYQEYFLGLKAAGAWGWQTFHLHVPKDMKIWESKPPGTLWATLGLLRDCFKFFNNTSISFQSVSSPSILIQFVWNLKFSPQHQEPYMLGIWPRHFMKIERTYTPSIYEITFVYNWHSSVTVHLSV